MNKAGRDLLVLFKLELMTPQAIQQETEKLHELLYDVERIDNLVIAHEVIDLNKYKLFRKYAPIRKILLQPELKSFVFLSCKN